MESGHSKLSKEKPTGTVVSGGWMVEFPAVTGASFVKAPTMKVLSFSNQIRFSEALCSLLLHLTRTQTCDSQGCHNLIYSSTLREAPAGWKSALWRSISEVNWLYPWKKPHCELNLLFWHWLQSKCLIQIGQTQSNNQLVRWSNFLDSLLLLR